MNYEQQPSSPDEFDIDDDASPHDAQWQSSTEQTSPSTTAQTPRPAPPMQKRRRVTRACDECRRKKIKCDGKQPCTHCVVYSYDCTYDQPSNRRRNPAPQYVEALEIRLQRAEALLRTYNSNVDLEDPNLDILAQQQGVCTIDTLKARVAQQKPMKPECNSILPLTPDAELQSMIESTGQLDVDERGHWDFHGGSSGVMFLRRMREQFGGILGHGTTKGPNSLLQKPMRKDLVMPFLDSPRSTYDSPNDSGLPNVFDLPSKEVAIVLCDCALRRACTLLRFVHMPTFYDMVDGIYDTPPESFTDKEHKFLPLLYQVLSVGCLFADDDVDAITTGENAIEASMEQGMKFFRAARSMVDITDCRDLTTLQCIIFMILFLQSTSNLSTCYSYIGVALRSALRLGLHRNISHNFNPIEHESRRRVFWIVRKMDTYVSAMLGFPRMLSDDDIDQELPVEVDDEYITKTAILPMPEGRISLLAACNAHTRLMDVLAKVIKYIYPTKGIEQACGETTSTYRISHAKIREIEGDLLEWLDKLPMALRPGGDADEDLARCQQLLRMAYAHVQMMLYRPFLHYVSSHLNAVKALDNRSYACTSACVSVSRNIVHITTELKRRNLLIGAYWFTMYTTFFAILSLVYFVLENPDKDGTQEILADAMAGKEALAGLARRSMAADRCSSSLKILFDQLPDNLKQLHKEPAVQKKKRSAPGPSTAEAQAQSSPEIATMHHRNPLTAPAHTVQARRAVTLPTHPRASTSLRQAVSMDDPRFIPNTKPESLLYHESMIPHHLTPSLGAPERPSSDPLQQTPFSYSNQAPSLAQLTEKPDLPDLTAMMFPSGDPFAYPNQPLMEYDHRQAQCTSQSQHTQPQIKAEPNSIQAYDSSNHLSPQDIFMGNNLGGYDALEGQLFGPLPPYLIQAQGGMDIHGLNIGVNAGVMQQGVYGAQHGPMLGASNLNFNDIFVDNGDGWSNMVGDGYR